jgi:hypothetical protein
MEAQGFCVTFSDPAVVSAAETTRLLGEVETTITRYICKNDIAQAAAIVYDVPAGSDMSQAIADAAADAAEWIGGNIAMQTWRAGDGPRVRLVSLRLRQDNQSWNGRIEAREIPGGVLVLAGMSRMNVSAAVGTVTRLFNSLKIEPGLAPAPATEIP